MNKIILSVFGVAAIIALLGIAGTSDRVDQIIYTMDEKTYREIRRELTVHGREPSDRKIAEYFMEHYNP